MKPCDDKAWVEIHQSQVLHSLGRIEGLASNFLGHAGRLIDAYEQTVSGKQEPEELYKPDANPGVLLAKAKEVHQEAMSPVAATMLWTHLLQGAYPPSEKSTQEETTR